MGEILFFLMCVSINVQCRWEPFAMESRVDLGDDFFFSFRGGEVGVGVVQRLFLTFFVNGDEVAMHFFLFSPCN